MVRYKPYLKLVILTFGKHVERTTARANQKQKMLRAVAHSSREWKKIRVEEDLTGLHQKYPDLCWFYMAVMVEPDPRQLTRKS